jgi:Protein of unknown function (DUF3987)/Primase C terminal 2 (PriCT-2)
MSATQEPHPRTVSGDFAAPPRALEPLCKMPHWLVWKWQRIGNGRKWTKPPFRCDDPTRHAANNDPSTWGTRSAAVKVVLAGKANGIGFALTNTEVGAADLDDCRDPETGKVDAWAQDILNAAPTAYQEVTVSGTGLRIIGTAKGIPQHKKFAISGGRPDAAIEVYRRAVRYVTVSGLEISNCTELPNIDALIDDLVARHDKVNGNSSTNGFDFDKHDQGERAEEPKPEWTDREEARVRAALGFIPAVDRQVWLHVGMSLHWTGWGDKARTIWDDWSRTAPEKFDERDQAKTWRGFRAQRDKAKTLATLFAMAIEGGWDSSVEVGQEASTSAAPHSWDDPDTSILDDRRGDLPAFPLDVLSPSWRQWATNAAHGAGSAVDHVVVPLLAVASSLVGAARRVQASKSWSEPLTCWTAIIGASGTSKTPGLDVTKRALAKIEHDRRTKLAELRRKYETEAERAKAKYKQWKEQVEEATAKGVPPPPMPSDADVPDGFIEPRLYVADATVQKLAVLLQARPCGILLMCDELAGLFLNMTRYANGGSDREFWLESWNGKPYVVERMGRNFSIPHLLIGMTGGFQPDKLARSFRGDADGLYTRLLFGWPAKPPYRPLTDAVDEVEVEFENSLVRLINLTADDEGELIATAVKLSSQAREAFEQFRKDVDAGHAALDGREGEWWAKAPAHVLRLAGTLAYMDWARRTAGQAIVVDEPNQIDRTFLDAAVRLVRDYFWPHARAALRQIGLSEQHTNARRVLRWLRANRKSEVSREEVRQNALGKTLDADGTEKLLASLVKAGWLRLVTAKTGGRPSRRWQVNPKISFTD